MEKIRHLLKVVGRRAAPAVYERMRAGHQLRVRASLDRITAQFVKRNLLEVVNGPFKGLKYTAEATAAHYPPKFLGTYERELHPLFEEIIARQYTVIIDVGCSEGYYAVGLAIRCPNAQVHAFDTDQNGQRWCRGLAHANNVANRVSVYGACTLDILQRFEGSRIFILCDCEGFEVELLDPRAAPMLLGCDILVELHDCYKAGTSEAVMGRFAETHDLQEIWPARRAAAIIPEVRFLSWRQRRLAANDLRGSQTHWAFMKARMAKCARN